MQTPPSFLYGNPPSLNCLPPTPPPQKGYHFLSPNQTIITFQSNVSQHCWAMHVAFVWPPCYDLLPQGGQMHCNMQYVAPKKFCNMLHWYICNCLFGALKCLFKVPPFFYIFVHNKSFRKILPNFNLLWTLELAFFGPLFPRITFPCSSLGWKMESMTSYSQKYHMGWNYDNNWLKL